jgi:hypothetical protein
MKKLLAIFGALVFGAGIAFAQAVPIPYVSSLGTGDIMQVIKNAAPSAGNTYATLTQLRAWLLGGNSAHSGIPALTSCGGGSPAIAGTDFAFRVTQGSTATGCVATFSTAFVSIPVCVAVNQTAPGTSTPAYSVTTTAITLVTASTSGEIWDVVCVAQNGG